MENKQDDQSGNNIIQKIDYDKLAKQFIEFFYNKWVLTPKDLLSGDIINDDSKLKYNNETFKGIHFVEQLFKIHEGTLNSIEILNCNSLDSGSRRIDILVNGNVQKDQLKISFTQHFLLIYKNKSWKIQNSILNMFI